MINFICPYSKKACTPSCEYWEYENNNSKSVKLNTKIPLEFFIKDFIREFFKPLIMNKFPNWANTIYKEYNEVLDVYFPENSILPKGQCKKMKNISENS